ncbi:unnamed protein product, partial [Pocillopora meandrina]
PPLGPLAPRVFVAAATSTTTFRTKNLFHYTNVIVQKNPDFGYRLYDVFDLENMNSADCKAEFRVEKADLLRLADALHITA